jgi:hypothetical protein
MLTKLRKNLTRKHFIKQANEFIKQLHNVKRNIYKESLIIDDINRYCELAIISNPRFDRGRFNEWITKGLYNE